MAIAPTLIQPALLPKSQTQYQQGNIKYHLIWLIPLGIVLGLICGMITTGHISLFPDAPKVIQVTTPGLTVTKQVQAPPTTKAAPQTQQQSQQVQQPQQPQPTPEPTPTLVPSGNPRIEVELPPWILTTTKNEQSEQQSTSTKESDTPMPLTTQSTNSLRRQGN